MLRIGSNCRIFGLRPEVVLAIALITPLFIKHEAEGTLSHAMDGKHSTNSLHYSGNAVDITFSSAVAHHIKLVILQSIQWMLGSDFDVLMEDTGKANEHIHIEFQPHTGYGVQP